MGHKYDALAINNYLEKALNLSVKAEALDKEQHHPEAFKLYKQTLQTYLMVFEEMFFDCIKFQERNEDMLRCLAVSDKYKAPSSSSAKRQVELTGFDATASIQRLPGIFASAPGAKWTDIVGHETPKFILKIAILDGCPVKHQVMYTGKRKSLKSILIFGPKGTGKSHLLKLVAMNAKDWTVFNIDCMTLLPCVTPGTEELHIKALFKTARACQWAVICVDNLEYLCVPPKTTELMPAHQKLRECFKNEIQELHQKHWAEVIIVIAATSHPELLDEELVKAFSRKVYMGLPRAEERFRILKQQYSRRKTTLTEADYGNLADKTVNYTGADIVEMARLSFKPDDAPIALADVEAALAKVKPSVTKEQIEIQLKFKESVSPTGESPMS